jgi:hypothetical protein
MDPAHLEFTKDSSQNDVFQNQVWWSRHDWSRPPKIEVVLVMVPCTCWSVLGVMIKYPKQPHCHEGSVAGCPGRDCLADCSPLQAKESSDQLLTISLIQKTKQNITQYNIKVCL